MPFEVFYGYKPEISHLRIFGSKAFAHIPKDEWRKLDAKFVKFIFIGYCDNHKAYKMFDLSKHKLIASRDVIFHENANDEISKYDNWYTHYDDNDHVKVDIDGEHEELQQRVQDQGESNMDTSNTLETPSIHTPHSRRSDRKGTQRKSTRKI